MLSSSHRKGTNITISRNIIAITTAITNSRNIPKYRPPLGVSVSEGRIEP
jgi:hypothetical protein